MKSLKKIIRKLYHLIWFLSLILVFIPNVDAKTTINWAGEVSHTLDGWFANCSSSSSCSQSGITQNSFRGFNEGNEILTFPGLMARLTTYNDNIGGQIGFSVSSVLKTDTLYSIRVYLCATGNQPNPIGWTTGNNDTDIGNHTYPADTKTSNFNNSANPQPFEFYSITGSNSVSSPSFYACRIHSVVFRPRVNSTFIGLQFNTNTTYTGNFWFIGYDLDVLGYANNITTSDINTAISNSGLATANSVSQVQQSITQVQQELGSIDDTLNDSSVDSSDNSINNLKTKIPTNSVISDLLLLPVRFLQNFVNALGSSCSQFNLGSLYGTNLFMPCINIQNYLGSAIWSTIDLIISGMFVYHLRKKFIEIYQNLTNLKNGGNEVD